MILTGNVLTALTFSACSKKLRTYSKWSRTSLQRRSPLPLRTWKLSDSHLTHLESAACAAGKTSNMRKNSFRVGHIMSEAALN